MAYKASASAGLRCRAQWLKLLSLKRRIEEARLREEQKKEADAKADKKEFLAEVEKTVVELNKRECCAIA